MIPYSKRLMIESEKSFIAWNDGAEARDLHEHTLLMEM
jgi:hypothetical protein